MLNRILFAGLLALGLWTPAHAETTQCIEIVSLPTTIATQGVYCLKRHLSTAISSGAAITVATNNVTIDCNDYKVGGLGGGPATTATGIYSDNHTNVTVRHCSIRGFLHGTDLSGSYLRVEDSQFDSNTLVGIGINGDGSVVRGNEVLDTGGGTSQASAYGILVQGDTDVRDNTVSGVLATTGGNGNAYGIYTNTNASGTVDGNRVRNLVPDGAGLRFGIYNAASGYLALRDNSVVLGGAVTGEAGLACTANGESAALGNVVLGVGSGTALKDCPDGGGNFSN